MVKVFKPQRQSQQTKRIELYIDTLDVHGVGVSRQHAPVVFVQGALPGERCEVLVTERKKRHWQATLLRVVEPSEQRQVPPCKHFSVCGGCQTQHMQADAMLREKQRAIEGLLNRHITQTDEADVLPWHPPLTDSALYYRRKSRLAIDARRKEIRIGFRQKSSSDVVDISECPVLTPSLQNALSDVRQVFNDTQKARWLGHIGLFEGNDFVQLLLHARREPGAGAAELCEQLAQLGNYQVVLSTSNGLHKVFGIEQPACFSPAQAIELEVSANDFVQVNDNINRRMVEQAMEWLDLNEDDRVLDLFCGVGNFSLPAARQVKHLHGAEGVASMVQRAAANAQKNGIHNTEFSCVDLNDAKAVSELLQNTYNKVLLDPSREGAEQVAKALAARGCDTVLYVSCNPTSFARDAGILLGAGYQFAKIGLMDMFPYTEHCELMALFTRASDKHKGK
ncbi:23S rRNA (uracil(1939)-C(5))-methyltransferase RlmD [Aestuariibacter salexigens]|uniref:23S rRNA (uracil(1939)-C(5))-methyltransferase RlmD n=1 Tax=Aestuariibacter salexigens TaxID=226010 RepID=UPI0004078489|nr:23S rRNA (uracil(1939)-C(5))-methyltransferase RlmD [Aestuariibacter salexigens]